MSLGNVQYQQQQQHQQQHPLLAAISGNNYAHSSSQHQRAGHLYHPLQSLRPLMGAGTHMHGTYAGSGSDGGAAGDSGYSGYGYEPSGGSGYDYHPAAPAHMPSGGSYAYHGTAGGTGYGAPAPAPAAPARPSLFGGGGKGGAKKRGSQSSSSSTMTALTLLAFFFFVNLLQSCLKDNMEAMNPTVMVMTAGVVRNRFNKLAEMNSRERNTSPASTFSSGANIIVQPGDVIAAAASSLAAASTEPTVTLNSPYSSGGGGYPGAVNNRNTRKPAKPQYQYNNNNYNNDNNNNNYNNNNNNFNNNYNNNNYNNNNDDYNSQEQLAPSTINRDPRPEFYESAHAYPNHTLVSATNSDRRRPYHDQPSHQEHPLPHSLSHSYVQQHSTHAADDHNDDDDRDRDQRHHFAHYSPAHHAHAPANAHSDGSYPWSYDVAGAASAAFSAHKRGPNAHSSASAGAPAWSSASLPAHISGNNYFDNDRYDDSYYTRIN